jgi:rSAM/selenodomain-associated transferase 1
MDGRRATICVMAKAPIPGRVKTRLARVLGEAHAAALAREMLADTVEALVVLDWARTVVATTRPDHMSMDGLAGDPELWDQGSGDLGARLERVTRRALAAAGPAIALGSDSPGLPTSRLDDARRALRDHDAVLGPCEDGGYYLIGLTRCPDGLLADLPWSARDTLARTRARLVERGFAVAELEPWFDVDVPDDLDHLRELLRAGDIDAPHTARLLDRI